MEEILLVTSIVVFTIIVLRKQAKLILARVNSWSVGLQSSWPGQDSRAVSWRDKNGWITIISWCQSKIRILQTSMELINFRWHGNVTEITAVCSYNCGQHPDMRHELGYPFIWAMRKRRFDSKSDIRRVQKCNRSLMTVKPRNCFFLSLRLVLKIRDFRKLILMPSKRPQLCLFNNTNLLVPQSQVHQSLILCIRISEFLPFILSFQAIQTLIRISTATRGRPSSSFLAPGNNNFDNWIVLQAPICTSACT